MGRKARYDDVGVNIEVLELTIDTEEEIRKVLWDMCNKLDEYFCSENEECLWEETLRHREKTNFDYVFNKCLEDGDYQDGLVDMFLKEWMLADSYFKDYDVKYIFDDENTLRYIIFSYLI